MDFIRWTKYMIYELVLGSFIAVCAFGASDITVPDIKAAVEKGTDTEVEEAVDKAVSPLQKRMSEYEEYAQKLRELRFKKPVQYRLVRKDEVKKILDRKLEEQLPEKEFNDKVEAYVKIGLLKSTKGVRDMILEMMSEQVAGFYDPDEHVLYVIVDLGLSEEFDAMIYVHELTHVLQDQHFGLNSLGIYDKGNDDRAVAALALVEGDATLIIAYYFSEYGKFSFKMLAQAMCMDNKKLNNAPYVLRRNFLFPYKTGVSFVTRLYAVKGWEGLNEAFKNPPKSTEQIMHPDKYIYEIDEPTEIKLPCSEKIFGREWRLIDDNVMGELNTQVLLRIFLGKWRSLRPSRGWDGDRYNVFKNPEDDSMIFVWNTVWDSEKDADEFFAAYIGIPGNKYRGREFNRKEGLAFSLWKSDRLSIFVGKMGNSVLVAEAPNEEILMNILSRFSDFKKLVSELNEENR